MATARAFLARRRLLAGLGTLLALGALAAAVLLAKPTERPTTLDRPLFPKDTATALASATGTPSATAVASTSSPPVAVAANDAPSRVVSGSMWSPALGRNMPYLVYLPRGYDSGDARYPVLYMLHGYGGGHPEWQYYGLLDAASRLIDAGTIPPMIIATPEGDLGYWMDHAYNGPKYGTYLARDVLAFVDGQYRTKTARMSRAIGGLSMGADGALDAAFHDPHLFGIVGAHSPVLRAKAEAHAFFGDQQYFEAHDPVSIVAKYGAEVRAAGFVMWLDSGEGDPWLPNARRLEERLKAASIPHTWRLYSGGHSGAYWQANLDDYLQFYGDAFRAAS